MQRYKRIKIPPPMSGMHCFPTPSYADIDECSDSNGGCDQICTNLEGSYECSCEVGYSLVSSMSCGGELEKKLALGPGYSGNALLCPDIDECLTDSLCDHSCMNSQGSFHCVCDEGFVLAADRATCAGMLILCLALAMALFK